MQICEIHELNVNLRGHVLQICEMCELHVNLRGFVLQINEIHEFHVNLRGLFLQICEGFIANLRDVPLHVCGESRRADSINHPVCVVFPREVFVSKASSADLQNKTLIICLTKGDLADLIKLPLIIC